MPPSLQFGIAAAFLFVAVIFAQENAQSSTRDTNQRNDFNFWTCCSRWETR